METYDTILETAQRLFARQGYTATAMHQIAEESGIGKATIYHHFRNKETILMTLVEKYINDMFKSLERIRAVSEPRQRIRIAAMLSLGFLYGSAELLQSARREVPGVRERLMSFLDEFFNGYMTLIEEAFIKGMDMKIFRTIDPHITGEIFFTMIQGNFTMLYTLGKRAESVEVAADRLLDVFFNGINAPGVNS